jgi:molybdate transport system substrate-binding protein
VKRFARVLMIAAAILSLTCGPTDAAERASERTTLTVFAASSLAETFTILGKEFQVKHPGVSVQFSFLASPTLATQMLAGAPADVFASASVADMKSVETLVPSTTLFASNRVVLATPRVNRFHINKLVDLNKRGVKWIQCAHIVPCGVAADSALASDGRITSKPVSLEPKVSSVVAKVVSGEVDAAIIYHTDYIAHKDVLREVRFKATEGAITHYPIGVLQRSREQSLAQSFVDVVLSAYGRKILAEAGFGRAK